MADIRATHPHPYFWAPFFGPDVDTQEVSLVEGTEHAYQL